MKFGRPSRKQKALDVMKDQPKIKRLIVEVEKDFHQKVKGLANKKGITIKELIHECLYKYINE